MRQSTDTPYNNASTISEAPKHPSHVLSDGNLTLSGGTTGVSIIALGTTVQLETGKWYWEIDCVLVASFTSSSIGVGITGVNTPFGDISEYGGWLGNRGVTYQGTNGNLLADSTNVAWKSTFSTGDIIGIALDMDSLVMEIYKNGRSEGIVTVDNVTEENFKGPILPYIGTLGFGHTVELKILEQSWTYPAPPCFLPITQGNMPQYVDVNNSAAFAAENLDHMVYTPPQAADSNSQFTYSTWIKRTDYGTLEELLSCAPSTNQYTSIFLLIDSSLQMNLVTGNANKIIGRWTGIQPMRDTSDWYHIVLAVDTTQVVESDGIKLWINGVQATLRTGVGEIYNVGEPHSFNNPAYPHYMNVFSQNPTLYPADCYVSETHMIDGIQQTGDDFGAFDANGKWLPIKYEGAYGTNGYYLTFRDGSNLGRDFSGNNNNWTNAGGTQSMDTPTNNYATISKAAKLGNTGTSPIEVSGRQLSYSSVSVWTRRYLSQTFITGKWYFEFQFINSGNNAGGGHVSGYAEDDLSQILFSIGSAGVAPVGAIGADLGIEFDCDAGTASAYENGVEIGTFTFSPNVVVRIACASGSSPDILTRIPEDTWVHSPKDYTYKGLSTRNIPYAVETPYDIYSAPTDMNSTSSGRYIGFGDIDGPFVFLGYRPDKVVIDNSIMYDNTSLEMDLLPNGFKLRSLTNNVNETSYNYKAWIASDFKQGINIGVAGDPHYKDVTLLLPFSDKTGINDRSLKNHTITNVDSGMVTIDKDPYSDELGSYVQAGVDDELTIAWNASDFAINSSDFTIDCWVYADSWVTFVSGDNISPNLVGYMNGTIDSTNWSFGPDDSGSLVFYYFNSVDNYFNSAITLATGQWQHIAVTHRVSDRRIQLFVNGVMDGETNIVGGMSNVVEPLTIGSSFGSSMTGNIADLRFTKAIRYHDHSVRPKSRVPEYYRFPDEVRDPLFDKVVLLVRSNGKVDAQNTFIDESSYARVLTGNGFAAYAEEQGKHENATSILFDGAGNDWVSMSDNPEMKFQDRTIDLCIEAWIWIDDQTLENTIMSGRDSNDQEEWTLSAQTGVTMVYGDEYTHTAGVISLNKWHHIAVVRYNDDGDGKGVIYVDGIGTIAPTSMISDTSTNSAVFYIGHNEFDPTQDFNGHIASIRITRNDRRYYDDFCPSLIDFQPQ